MGQLWHINFSICIWIWWCQQPVFFKVQCCSHLACVNFFMFSLVGAHWLTHLRWLIWGLLLLTVGYPSIIYMAKNHSLAKYLSKMFFTTLLLVIARLSCAFFSWYDNHFSAFVFQQTSMLLRSQLVLHKTFQVSDNLTLYLVFYWHHNIIWMTNTYSLWFVLCFHVKPH